MFSLSIIAFLPIVIIHVDVQTALPQSLASGRLSANPTPPWGVSPVPLGTGKPQFPSACDTLRVWADVVEGASNWLAKMCHRTLLFSDHGPSVDKGTHGICVAEGRAEDC